MLEVLVLGGVQAREAGRPLHPGGPKQRLILAHLVAAAGKTVEIDTLAADLWLAAPADPTHAIQAHISRLRSALSIEIERVVGGYRLEPRHVRADSTEFERLHQHGLDLFRSGSPAQAVDTLQQALGLWRGPAYADLSDRLGLQPHIARLERLKTRATGDLVDAELAAGETERLIPMLYGLVEHEPLIERYWEQLVRALNLAGHRSEAMDAFARARAVLDEQLGIEPGEELQRVHLSVLSGIDSGLSTAEPFSPRPRVVGRDSELAVLQQAWQDSQGGFKVVTATGDPGIGKTRLVADFVAGLAGARVLWGRCRDTFDIAYQPFVEILREDCAQLEGDALSDRLGARAADLGRLIPDVVARLPDGSPSPLTATPEIERYRILDGLADWFAVAAADQPLCVVIDDLHWADPETPHVLRHLISVAAGVPALLILTYRDRESRDDEAAADQFAEFIRQSQTVIHMPLSGLETAAVGELLSTELERFEGAERASQDLISRVVTATGGNPLFIVELARHLQALSDLSIDELPGELPAGLRAVIGARLSRLSEPIRDTLQVAAVLGQSFDPLLLGRVSGIAYDELDGFLVATTYARLIEEVPGTVLRYQFCHALLRAAAYEAIAPIRRARLHQHAAETIERHYGVDATDHYHDLAHHYCEAAILGCADRAIYFLMLAGDTSLARRAPSAALQMYERAWRLLPADAPPEARCDILLRRGSAEFEAGLAYRENLLAAARIAQQQSDEPRLTQAAVTNNRGWYSSTSEVDRERILIIEAALTLCTSEKPASRSRLLALWAMENVREPRHRAEALARSHESFNLAMRVDDPVLHGEIMSHRFSVLYATFADPEGCVELAQRLYDFAHARVDPELQLNAAIALAQSTMMLGDFAMADQALARSRLLAEELGHPARTWLVHNWQATRTMMLGDLERGEAESLEALELGIKYEQPDAFTWFAGQLFMLRHLTGQLAELVEAIEQQAITHADGIPAWRAAYALALTTVGRDQEAERILDEFLGTDFRQLPQDMLYLHGMCFLAEASIAVGRVDAANALYAHLLRHTGLIANNGTIDAGPVDLYLAKLALTGGDHALAAQHANEARSFCQRATAPLWLERVQRLENEIALDFAPSKSGRKSAGTGADPNGGSEKLEA